jgi:hypothetical protein
MAPLMQLSAHFQHEVQARLLRITGRLSRISMMSSGQTMAQTPVLSHVSVSIEIVMAVLRESARPKPRAVMEPIQVAV